MAETAPLVISERAGEIQPGSESALFHRRIEFHQARKPFSGFGDKGCNGFKLVTLNPSLEPRAVSGLGKKKEKASEFCEIGLDPELSFEISFRRIGAGLRNLGNTCFLNSVLQCLTYTEPLAAYLQSGKHQNSCRTAGFCALCAIQKHVSRALQSTGRILEPKDLVSNLRRISRNFQNCRQEDAHEYMVYLLESMHKCCLPSGVPSESPSAYEKSLVHKIFGGRLRSQVKCMQCSYCSNKFDPFLDLSLEIAKADSLEKALTHFTTKELLDGGAKEYQCQECKQKVKAIKQLTIHKAPYVLTVHLKRFSSLAPGQKIDKKVAFCPSLDLKRFVSGSYDGDLKYTLYGVLVHAGWSTRSGHYYCFVRTSSGMWYSLDDNQVVQVNERKVLEQKAYMLFYVRDRRSFCPKKPVDVMQKQNMVMNGIGHAAYSKQNVELSEKFQKCSNQKNSSGSFSVSSSERDVAVITQADETPEKAALTNTNAPVGVDNLGLNKDSTSEHSSVVPPTNDHSIVDVNSVGRKRESSLMAVSSGAQNVDCNKRSYGVEEQNASAIVLDNGNVLKDSFHRKESSGFPSTPSVFLDSTSESAKKLPGSSVFGASSEDTCKMDGANSEMCASEIVPVGAIAEPSKKADHVTSSQQKCDQNSQVGGPPVVTTDPTIEGTCENDQKKDDAKSELLSGLSAATEPLSHRITMKKGLNLKVRRKIFMCRVGATSLSSNLILGVGLCMRKKKHKRGKHSSVQKKLLIMENLSHGNESAAKLGQYVNGGSFPVLIDNCSHSQKKKAPCGSDGQNQKLSVTTMSAEDDSMPGDVIYNEYRERIAQNGSTDSVEKQPEIRQFAAEEDQMELRQADVMTMLTKGLDEITVACWDGIDVSLSQKLEKRAAKTAQIGYIGDEWDEEYDRGKRKKIRGSKISFGGPNLFQEIAAQNSKRKRAKLERPRLDNQPFRI